MDQTLLRAVEAFNSGRFAEVQDVLEQLVDQTRAASERRFYAVLDNLTEVLLQMSDGDLAEAEAMLVPALGQLDAFVPRFRRINVEALREDYRAILGELREMRSGKRESHAPSKLPRLRILPE